MLNRRSRREHGGDANCDSEQQSLEEFAQEVERRPLLPSSADELSGSTVALLNRRIQRFAGNLGDFQVSYVKIRACSWTPLNRTRRVRENVLAGDRHPNRECGCMML